MIDAVTGERWPALALHRLDGRLVRSKRLLISPGKGLDMDCSFGFLELVFLCLHLMFSSQFSSSFLLRNGILSQGVTYEERVDVEYVRVVRETNLVQVNSCGFRSAERAKKLVTFRPRLEHRI